MHFCSPCSFSLVSGSIHSIVSVSTYWTNPFSKFLILHLSVPVSLYSIELLSLKQKILSGLIASSSYNRGLGRPRSVLYLRIILSHSLLDQYFLPSLSLQLGNSLPLTWYFDGKNVVRPLVTPYMIQSAISLSSFYYSIVAVFLPAISSARLFL